jgi:UDP-2,3-diacylglucosamine hydrolase
VINGDLFEFWFEWKSVIPRASFRVLAALGDLVDAGIPVLWIAGNHDCWGGDVLRQDVAVEYHVGAWTGELAGWRTRIEHGDGLREVEDRKYRRLRTVLRHPASIWAFRHLLHPDFGSRLAAGSSHASRTYQAKDGGRGLRAVAIAELDANPPLELLIYGHSHVATLERGPHGSVYANAGSWMSKPTFLRVDDQQIQLLEWSGSAEGERLHALDRGAEKALPHP